MKPPSPKQLALLEYRCKMLEAGKLMDERILSLDEHRKLERVAWEKYTAVQD